MSASTPKKLISKDDYTLAHYLILKKLVSAEADALKNLYLKIGSTSPSLRLTSKQIGCMIQMPQLICASILNIKLVFVTTLLQSCIRSGLLYPYSSQTCRFAAHGAVQKHMLFYSRNSFILMIHINNASNSKTYTYLK